MGAVQGNGVGEAGLEAAEAAEYGGGGDDEGDDFLGLVRSSRQRISIFSPSQ